MRPRLRLLLVTVAAAATLGTLLLARPPLSGSVWAHGDDLALAVAWAIAVAAGAWLFVATGACVIALGCTRPTLARRLARALPFAVRRLVELAVVTSCVALPALPAQAAAPAPVVRIAVAVGDEPVVRAPEPATAAPPAPVESVPAAPVPSAPNPVPPPSRVVVRAGDNLWLIARASLMQTSGRRPGDAEIARYWHAVIAANRSTLRSGDPSLIFPGEIVALPPPAAVS